MMRRLSRRQFVRGALGGSAWLTLQGLGGAGCDDRSGDRRAAGPQGDAGASGQPGAPRYFVQILLSGGHDPVYTTDPKQRSEVESDIALPSDNRIVEAGSLRLGPHIAKLEPFAPNMSFLNGVPVGTANHETGLQQFLRLKTNISSRMPSALDVIGAHRDTQPLGVAYLNLTGGVLHSPGYLGTADAFYFGQKNLFERAQAADPERLLTLAKTLRRQARGIRGRGASAREEITADHIEQAAALFERLPHVEPFTPEQRSDDYVAQTMSETLQRALWLIENDLARGVFIDAGQLGWDTHINNEPRQATMNSHFATYFSEFLSELPARANDHGPLEDTTAVVVGSDLGRFPKLNDMLGKDHLPQTAFMFTGAGFTGGRAFGRTGTTMEALPISVATGGEPKGPGRLPILDDVGTTMIASAGLDPQRYGYNGKVLEFLFA